MSMEFGEDAPSPRLCHLIKWPDFDGYGFNLHAEKAKTGQYIGKVDDDSPASTAGLREGDRIIEVNLVNIANENHRQVVERIKSIPNETKLLVIDDVADRWYKERKLIVKSSQSNVLHLKTPVPQPIAANTAITATTDANSNASNQIIVNGNGIEDNLQNQVQTQVQNEVDNEVDNEVETEVTTNGIEHKQEINANGSALPPIIQDSQDPQILENGCAISSGSSSPSISRSQKSSEHTQSARPSSGASNTNTIPDSPVSSKSSSSNGMVGSESGADLNLNMTASEMRKILAQRKKHDAKNSGIDLKEKYQIIQLL